MRESRTSVVVFSATILREGRKRAEAIRLDRDETRRMERRIETNLEGIFSWKK